MNKFATQNEMNYRRKSNTMTKLSALLIYAYPVLCWYNDGIHVFGVSNCGSGGRYYSEESKDIPELLL